MHFGNGDKPNTMQLTVQDPPYWFKQYHARNENKDPCDLDLWVIGQGYTLWPTTWILAKILEVVKAQAKFHQAKCSSSSVIVPAEKKLNEDTENNTATGSDSNYDDALWPIMTEVQ